tara:strand:- start:123 stop:395 length:273 start_codon:yes stop_codon:yes gene_type:complete
MQLTSTEPKAAPVPTLEEQLESLVDNNLPYLLECISAICAENAKYIRTDISWANKNCAMAWEHATRAIDLATNSAWNTLPDQSISERGAY